MNATSTRIKPWVALAGSLLMLAAAPASAADPWADAVISYTPGSNPAPGYTDPSSALGEPARFTGVGVFPSVVSVFNPPYLSTEVVSIGEGGSLVVRFDEPIVDDPTHRFGIDLLIFSNFFFVDADYPNGAVGDPPFLFGSNFGNATVEVSANGIDYFPVYARDDRLFPTQGYLDSGPFDLVPGLMPSNFLRAMNPALSVADFAGLTYAQVLALYDGSGGGVPIDISTSGLPFAHFVRVSVPDDKNTATNLRVEIDAMAAVPEPATLLSVLVSLGAISRRTRRMGRG